MVAGAIVLVIGGVLLSWGIRIARRHRRAAKEHTRTTGIVLENRITEGMDFSTFYCPVVEFTAAGGRTYRVQCHGNTQFLYPVGTRVPVLYHPDGRKRQGSSAKETSARSSSTRSRSGSSLSAF